jgi:hypothetical protein
VRVLGAVNRRGYDGRMTETKSRLLALFAAILAAAALRLVPHPPNFAPIGAMALFSGAYLPRRPLSFVAPLVALFLSDLAIGFYHGMATVYVATALIVLLGWWVAKSRTPLRIGAAAVASSLLFYLITNLGVWAFSGMYPLTPAGLAACYIAAIPFFQNTVAGDLFFTGLLFGGFALLEHSVPALREPRSAVATWGPFR